jgi:cytoskeleton protein RodZ
MEAAKPQPATPLPPASPPAAAPGKTAAADAGAVEKAGGPGKRIEFHFVGESWVEVRDGRGRILFQRLNPAGTDAQIAGRPPLQVVVGNAPEVEMSLDGRRFDLEPHTNVAVARFTLE